MDPNHEYALNKNIQQQQQFLINLLETQCRIDDEKRYNSSEKIRPFSQDLESHIKPIALYPMQITAPDLYPHDKAFAEAIPIQNTFELNPYNPIIFRARSFQLLDNIDQITEHHTTVDVGPIKINQGKIFNQNKNGDTTNPLHASTFFKKYSRRSQDLFNRKELNENKSEDFSFKSLGLGPAFQFKSDMTKLIEKFDRCLSYLSHLAISRENAVAQPTENWKSVNYLLNYPRNLKITLKMYWDHLHLIIIDEYEKVCSQTLHLENVCNKNGIIHADSRKEVLEDFLEAKENFVQETQFLGILYLTTTMAIINQEELSIIKSALDYLIYAIRSVDTHIWAIAKIIERAPKPCNNSNDFKPIGSVPRRFGS